MIILVLVKINGHLNQMNSINLTIEITDFCNFHCNYCSQGTNHNNKELMNFNFFKRNLLMFKRECIKKGINQFFLIIQGGELSIYKKEQIIPYFEYIKTLFSDIPTRLVFPTNFSGKLSFFNSLILTFKNSNILFIINISLHQEMLKHNYEEKFIKIEKYLKHIHSKKVIIQISILKVRNYNIIYNKFISFIHNKTELYYFYENLDDNDPVPKNILYYTLNEHGFLDNINQSSPYIKIFKIKNNVNQNLSQNPTQLEIENKRKISYDNEIELLQITRR